MRRTAWKEGFLGALRVAIGVASWEISLAWGRAILQTFVQVDISLSFEINYFQGKIHSILVTGLPTNCRFRSICIYIYIYIKSSLWILLQHGSIHHHPLVPPCCLPVSPPPCNRPPGWTSWAVPSPCCARSRRGSAAWPRRDPRRRRRCAACRRWGAGATARGWSPWVQLRWEQNGKKTMVN